MFTVTAIDLANKTITISGSPGSPAFMPKKDDSLAFHGANPNGLFLGNYTWESEDGINWHKAEKGPS